MADIDSININETKQLIFLHDAIELGLKKYFTGEPCQHGHLTDRYVANRTCVECALLSRRRIYETYYAKNKEKVNKRNKDNEKIHGYGRKYREKNRLELNKKQRNNYPINKAKINLAIKIKKQSNNLFRMKTKIVSVISNAFRYKKFNKKMRTQEILGCTYEQFVVHIEKQFTKDINWNNRSKWHLDHIVPLSTAKTIEDIEKLNHHTNIRPLLASENIRKSNKSLFLI